MKLHLGAGTRSLTAHGYKNVDLMAYPHIDIVSSVEHLPMVPTDSCEVVYSCHILEHVSRSRTQAVLEEWRRILKPGGTLRVAVPDFTALAKLYLWLHDEGLAHREKDRFNNPISYALSRVVGPAVGGQTGIYDFHMNLFDESSLKWQLEAVGFTNVRKYDWRETEHADVDDYSRSYYPHMDFKGTLLSLNMEATK